MQAEDGTPEPLATLRAEARFGLGFLRRHGLALAGIFVGVLLPLLAFGVLAARQRGGAVLPFDLPLLDWARSHHAPALDVFFALASALGYRWFVLPASLLLVAVAAWRRQMRRGLFAGLAVGGSAALNLAAKPLFARDRPTLWESILPESSYSFPSGHAMGSMALVCTVLVLAWPTRARWPLLLAGLAFIAWVGASRVYLGVHYPSDILAGWAASLAWVLGLFRLVFQRQRPLEAAGARR